MRDDRHAAGTDDELDRSHRIGRVERDVIVTARAQDAGERLRTVADQAARDKRVGDVGELTWEILVNEQDLSGRHGGVLAGE